MAIGTILQTENIKIYVNFFIKVIPEVERQFGISAFQMKSCLPEAFLKQAHPELSGYLKDLRSAGILALMPGIDLKNAIEFMVSLQSVCFCLDFLCENRRLHDEALVNRHYQPLYDSVYPERPISKYYEYYGKAVGEYLESRVEICRNEITRLPSQKLVTGKMKKYVQLHIGLQACKNQPENQRLEVLYSWCDYYIRQFQDISFQEFSASADSLLGIYSMFISASDPTLTEEDIKALDYVYLPWVCALHKLLQHFATAREDIMTGRLNFADCYNNLMHCEEKIGFLLSKSLVYCSCLKSPEYHLLLIKLLPAIYLSDPRAQFGLNRLASRNLFASAPYETSLLNDCCRFLKLY